MKNGTFAIPHGLTELKEILEETWPARTAALRASGVPLNEGEAGGEGEGEGESGAGGEGGGKQKPPWGDEEKNFDADRAWKLIQDTRADREKIKTERDDLRTAVKKHEDASKSEQEKAAERATAAEREASAARVESARLRVALKKGLTETQAKRLVGESEEELEKDADELLASFKDESGSGQGPARRPKENLRPGAVPGAEAEETDPAKLAAQVPRLY